MKREWFLRQSVPVAICLSSALCSTSLLLPVFLPHIAGLQQHGCPEMCWETSPHHMRMCVCFSAYRGLLTLYARAVKPQSWDAVRVALDVKDALVISLSRLRLGQVLSQQGDRPHNSSRDVDLGGGQDLRALLEVRKKGVTKTIISRECDRTF